MNAIEVKNLTIKYGDLTAVDNVSFSVKEGEIYGIIGPNGAGKTSTLECMEGLRQSKSGEINILGSDARDRNAFYKKVGIQLQETKFQDNIKVKELIALYSSFYDNPANADDLLAQFDITEKKNAFVRKLSGGQRQKLAIILALIGNPKILVLDEISTGLDPHARVQIWDKIKQLNKQGITILLTTHFMEEAEHLCDRVCLLVNGKIKAYGTLNEMIKQADLKTSITAYAKQDELLKLDAKKAPDGVKIEVSSGRADFFLSSTADISRTMAWLCNLIQITDLDLYKPKLEDVFLKLTGAKLAGAQLEVEK